MPNRSFPPPSQWSPDGLVTIGGPLTAARVIEAYRSGVFPWPVDEREGGLLWWSPNPRAVLFPERLHVPRRLERTLRQGRFAVTTDRAFSEVIRHCGSVAERQDATWITPGIQTAYHALHRAGVVHSVEVWADSRLVGGLYGVCMGAMFAGESMFSLERDASKVALVWLVRHLAVSGCRLFDVQVASEHLAQFGVEEIERRRFLPLLAAVLREPDCWRPA
jgi:leucyl/phenylalanyl-tRNA--protein transferase